MVSLTKKNAGKGVDQLSRGFVQDLGQEGQHELYVQLTSMWFEIIPATQMLSSVVAMLPKAATYWRPIALLHMLYRWWMKMLRPLIAQWDADNSGPWDAAVKGKGCEQ